MSDAERGVGRDLDIPLPQRRRVFVRLEDLPSDDEKPGKRVQLRQPNAAFLRVARQYDTDPQGQPELLWQMAGILMPDLTEAEVERLSPQAVMDVIEVMKRPIADLEVLAKNAVPPLVEAAKGSSSQTPSPTRSRRSARASGLTSTP